MSPASARARYIGLDKTRLEHTAAAAAVNLLRLDAWWTGRPLDRTRTTHLQRLDFSRADLSQNKPTGSERGSNPPSDAVDIRKMRGI